MFVSMKKIVIFFMVVIFFLVGIILVQNKSYNNKRVESSLKSEALLIEKNLMKVRTLVRTYNLSREEKEIGKIRKELRDSIEICDKIIANSLSGEEQSKAESMKVALYSFQSTLYRILKYDLRTLVDLSEEKSLESELSVLQNIVFEKNKRGLIDEFINLEREIRILSEKNFERDKKIEKILEEIKGFVKENVDDLDLAALLLVKEMEKNEKEYSEYSNIKEELFRAEDMINENLELMNS